MSTPPRKQLSQWHKAMLLRHQEAIIKPQTMDLEMDLIMDQATPGSENAGGGEQNRLLETMVALR